MPTSAVSDYFLQSSGSQASCTSTGCTITYEFVRAFNATNVDIEAGKVNHYEFYGFYEQASGDKGITSAPVQLLLGAYNSLAASIASAVLLVCLF
jgi:hypothetical protein